ncbi:hypothetical protein ABZ636_00595 [Streptomyces sp. NPDC007251]|uniref:hypothetical protein n=1 Tax=Streptomyces sp. NPDC007251 TaxID=3154483 RepID=UPI0034111D4A
MDIEGGLSGDPFTPCPPALSRIGEFPDTLADLVVITLCLLIAEGTAIGPRERSARNIRDIP